MTSTLCEFRLAPDNASTLDPVLRAAIALAGLVMGLNGVTGLVTLLSGTANHPDLSPGATVLASALLQPILGFAAAHFALLDRLPYGIISLALLLLAKCTTELPSVVNHGLGLAGDPLVVTHRLLRSALLPVSALAAMAAARANCNPAVAVAAVILPGLIEIAGIAAFAISLGAPVL